MSADNGEVKSVKAENVDENVVESFNHEKI